MANVKNVIFDIGNVLMAFKWSDWIGSIFSEDVCRKISNAFWGDDRWNEMDRGVMAQEAVHQSFLDAEPDVSEEIEYVYSHIGDACHRTDYAIPWIKELKERGLKVYYLSNYSVYLRNMRPDVLDFLDYMDGGVFSCDVKFLKPDEAIYRSICEKYSLEPAECVFIDDLVKNIEGALSYGMNGIIYKNYHQARADLDRLLEGK